MPAAINDKRQRDVLALYAAGKDVDGIVAQTSLDREHVVFPSVHLAGFDRGRARQMVTEYDARTAKPRTGLPAELLAAIRIEHRDGADAIARATTTAITKAVDTITKIHRPVAAAPDPAAAAATAEILATVQAVQIAVQELAELIPAPLPDTPADGVLDRYDAWQCPACGSRYSYRHRHDCGPLRPVTVTITDRTVGGG